MYRPGCQPAPMRSSNETVRFRSLVMPDFQGLETSAFSYGYINLPESNSVGATTTWVEMSLNWARSLLLTFRNWTCRLRACANSPLAPNLTSPITVLKVLARM